MIGFFGITRSLPHTAEAIRTGFYEPLAKAGMLSLRAGHFNLPETINNPRSGEFGIAADRRESCLLDLDVCWSEPQKYQAIARQFEFARRFPDAFGDDYRSLANVCYQLHSLARLWSLLELLGVDEHDIVLLLRPDLLYLDTFDPIEDLKPLLDGSAEWVVPAWQSWGGLNDRFAFCTGRAARIYATRASLFEDACRRLGTMHGESFLRIVAEHHGIRVAKTGLRAIRIRANGRIAANDASMINLPPIPPATGRADTDRCLVEA